MGLRARVSNSTALRAGEGRAAGPGSGTRAVCILGQGFGLGLGSRPGVWVGARVGDPASAGALCRALESAGPVRGPGGG